MFAFWIGLLHSASLSRLFYSSIHSAANSMTFTLQLDRRVVYMYHICIIHSSAEGHLGVSNPRYCE